MIETLLPFTKVDELGCHFDTPDEPNSIHLEVRVAGRLDADRLRVAVRAALAAHPLARARRGPWHRLDRRFHWEITDVADVQPIEPVCWRDDTQLAAHRSTLLNATSPLELSPPLRIRHATGPTEDVLIVNTHHAAMDGLSSLRLLGSIARRYAGRPDPLGADPLAVRTPIVHRSEAGERDLRSLRPSARIAADRADPGPGCGFQLMTIPVSTVHARHTTTATVNDLLIAAMIRAVVAWNAAHGSHTGPIRITMPINAREPNRTESGAPLGNLSRLAVITNTPDRRDRTDRLLRDITEQTTAAKHRGGAQIDMISNLLATAMLPVTMKARLVEVSRRLAAAAGSTALVSNLGIVTDPPDFGADHPATGLWFSPPTRMPGGLAVGALTVRGQLHLCLRYRRALLDRPAADRFGTLLRVALGSLGDPRLVSP
ncbi:hypothetical protein [Amycolatopsis sp. H20-H5]|uniref:hypothetical protein n=1 Tax=Amycolatopsis sp. H20-H5 TaxID=3046309 RepID=UPI002DB5BF31|nr:hypothetical protein [Amycolatopsis sp. H20-H5]MEC3980074.1 hypothetical protein [Amycolatopsis sp. H20-H5]